MELQDVENIFLRIGRLKNRIDDMEGSGTQWFADVSTGDVHEYIINGVKPLEDLEDDILGAYVWLWSLKDYIKELALAKKVKGQWVEEQVNGDSRLCIGADIANSIKHGKLKSSRSTLFPKLSKLHYQIPQSALSSITVFADKVELEVESADKATLTMAIVDKSGNEVDDALELLDYLCSAWSDILSDLTA